MVSPPKDLFYHIIFIFCILFSGTFIILRSFIFYHEFSQGAVGTVKIIERNKANTIHFTNGKSSDIVLFTKALADLTPGDRLVKSKYSFSYYINDRKVIDLDQLFNYAYIPWLPVLSIILLFSTMLIYKIKFKTSIHNDPFYRQNIYGERCDFNTFQFFYRIFLVVDILFFPFGLFFMLLGICKIVD